MKYPELKLFIDGQWRDAPHRSDVLNPFDSSVVGTLPHAGDDDLASALDAARRGFELWRRTPVALRATIMLEAARLLRERIEEIAYAITLDQGKPVAQSRAEVQRAADIIEWDANEGRRTYGRIIPGQPGLQQLVLVEPIGVVAAFSPWNFPISSPARKLGGALASGCSIILKAAEEAPAGAVHLVRAFADAGVPAGVINLVFGNPDQISRRLIEDPVVRAITFTGSIPVGKQLAALAGSLMKPAVMELGGHAPVIVCDDVDVEAVARECVKAKARNAGQICVSPTRFFVHEAVFDRFVTAACVHAGRIVLGNGLDPATQMGPLANTRRLRAVEGLVDDALSKGARLLTGGKRPGAPSSLFPLTVLANIGADARAMNEEPFGPLMLVNPVKSLDEAIERANALPVGLAAYAFTSSASRVAALSESVQCGSLAINHFTASVAETPFGGVRESGYGREGGMEGLHAYTTVKLVSHLTEQRKS